MFYQLSVNVNIITIGAVGFQPLLKNIAPNPTVSTTAEQDFCNNIKIYNYNALLQHHL